MTVTTPTCSTCRFSAQPNGPGTQLFCHYNPPQMLGADLLRNGAGQLVGAPAMWGWPGVQPDQWCGRFAAKRSSQSGEAASTDGNVVAFRPEDPQP